MCGHKITHDDIYNVNEMCISMHHQYYRRKQHEIIMRVSLFLFYDKIDMMWHVLVLLLVHVHLNVHVFRVAHAKHLKIAIWFVYAL